jgi:PhoPQ-activated pathogenicity-related protein
MKRILWLIAAILPCPLVAKDAPAEIPTTLGNYLEHPDFPAKWEIKSAQKIGTCEYWHLSLVSQEWQGFTWEHDLIIFRPADVPIKGQVLLLNEGGSFRPEGAIYGATIANMVKIPVAILLGVPKQPLFDGKTEDHLIAETFIRYLETGDTSWPLLFPMVKSVVKGMDAVQEFTAKEWGTATESFILTGASKRGWTTWLTATQDKRVSAIAPMVIDLLNIPLQVPHQIARFGRPSDSIAPYTERDLVPIKDTPEARLLWKMVDPWSYRANLSMPKMVVLGNNDPYWTTDALNLYWDGLPGDKYISYSPNAGHNLVEVAPDGTRGLPLRALSNVAAFVRCHVAGEPMPQLTWTHDVDENGGFRLDVAANPRPLDCHLWIAHSDTEDFRQSRWEKSAPLEISADGSVRAAVPRPVKGFVAFYADLGYRVGELPLQLCTQLRVGEATNVE